MTRTRGSWTCILFAALSSACLQPAPFPGDAGAKKPAHKRDAAADVADAATRDEAVDAAAAAADTQTNAVAAPDEGSAAAANPPAKATTTQAAPPKPADTKMMTQGPAMAMDGGTAATPPIVAREPETLSATVDPTCDKAGCIRSFQELGDYAKSDIETYLEMGVSIDNGYSVYVVEYVTGNRTSLATVTIPYPLEVPAAGYHIVVNAHGTAGLDDACKLSNTTSGTGLAALFGARGAIGIAPDGPGLGTPGILPYLVSQPSGLAVLDAMRAASNVAAIKAVPTSKRYAAVGLSEGGHSVLAAAALHGKYAPELDIRAFGVSGPASMWFEKWQAGINYDGPGVSSYAMLFYAWSKYYNYSGPSLWAKDLGPRIDDIMTTACWYDVDMKHSTFEKELGDHADAVFDSQFLAAFRAGSLPPTAASLMAGFTENRVGPYTQTAPLSIWQGDSDTTVPLDDTNELVRVLQQGGVVVDYHVVLGGDHLTTAYGFGAQNQKATKESIAWVQDLLDK